MDLIREELTTLFLRNRATRRETSEKPSKAAIRNSRARREIEALREKSEIDHLFVC